jgi:DNA-binding NarL/FixJ family response regulator
LAEAPRWPAGSWPATEASRTLLNDGAALAARGHEPHALPRSLAAAVGDQLRGLAPETRTILEMLAVLSQRMPLAQLGQAAQAGSPSTAIASPLLSAGGCTTGPPRETEVAHLIGKGMSNPEIAAELFVSRKAVEYHLGNIYAKCGLRGRQQLRRFVESWAQPAAV